MTLKSQQLRSADNFSRLMIIFAVSDYRTFTIPLIFIQCDSNYKTKGIHLHFEKVQIIFRLEIFRKIDFFIFLFRNFCFYFKYIPNQEGLSDCHFSNCGKWQCSISEKPPTT